MLDGSHVPPVRDKLVALGLGMSMMAGDDGHLTIYFFTISLCVELLTHLRTGLGDIRLLSLRAILGFPDVVAVAYSCPVGCSFVPPFLPSQVTTTRNVTSTPFVDWFCGGLQYQVDHHLFPQLPRHNFKKVHDLVASFCQEHGVSYHEATFVEGTKEVLRHLDKVAKEFITDFPAM